MALYNNPGREFVKRTEKLYPEKYGMDFLAHELGAELWELGCEGGGGWLHEIRHPRFTLLLNSWDTPIKVEIGYREGTTKADKAALFSALNKAMENPRYLLSRKRPLFFAAKFAAPFKP